MKNNSIKYFIFLFLLISISSCTYNVNAINKNRIEDKEEAEKITTLFYECILNEDIEKTHNHISPSFFEVTKKEELDSFILNINNQLGKIIKIDLVKWETEVKKGTSPESNYFLTYRIDREKHFSDEYITLRKEKGEIKILGYKVNSDGFLNK